MILLVVSVLLMAKLSGIMDPSWKLWKRGAVLLLDEIDLASNKILCLQSILEGKGVFLKKIGKMIQPKEGFNVFILPTPKVRVLMMDVSLAPMFSMRHS